MLKRSLLITCILFLPALITFSEESNPLTDTSQTAVNIFFLDRAKGEDTRLIEELATLTPTVETNLKLGWLHLIYRNDAPRAKEYFQKTLADDSANMSALSGLSDVYGWLGEDENYLANNIRMLKLDPNAPWLELVLDNLGGSGGGRVYPNCGRVHDSESGSTVGLNSKQYLQLLEELLAKPLTNKFNETIIKERLFNARMALSGVSEELFKYWKTLGYPNKWLVIGYFKGSGEAAIDETFPPEREINPDALTGQAKYPVDDWDVKWHKRIATISNFDYFQ
ncbi:MAG: hypothetical protein HY762_03385, partial [Planctomycetes bacterium]|nr:hypothetical protein [Planctomycetota bacterium]